MRTGINWEQLRLPLRVGERCEIRYAMENSFLYTRWFGPAVVIEAAFGRKPYVIQFRNSNLC